MRTDDLLLTHIIVECATAARTVANSPCSLLASLCNDVGAIIHGNEIVTVEFRTRV